MKQKRIFKLFFKGFILAKCKIIGDKNFQYEQRWKVIPSFVAELGFPRSD